MKKRVRFGYIVFVLMNICFVARGGAHFEERNEEDYADVFVVQKFLDNPKSLNDPINEYGETWLHYYAKHNKITLLRQYLALGADKDIQDDFGETPLYKAVDNCHVEAIEILLAAGVEKTIKTKYGSTAVQRACLVACESVLNCFDDDDILVSTFEIITPQDLYGSCCLHKKLNDDVAAPTMGL